LEKEKQSQAVDRLMQLLEKTESEKEQKLNMIEEQLWDILLLFQGETFYTAKNLEYTYTIRGNEMFVSRKDKSITRATIKLGIINALESGRALSGPKKLGCFGASYLYPIFLKIGFIENGKRK